VRADRLKSTCPITRAGLSATLRFDREVRRAPWRAFSCRVGCLNVQPIGTNWQFADVHSASDRNNRASCLHVRNGTDWLRVAYYFAGSQIDDPHLNLHFRWRLPFKHRFINLKVGVQNIAFSELSVAGRLEFNVFACEWLVISGEFLAPSSR